MLSLPNYGNVQCQVDWCYLCCVCTFVEGVGLVRVFQKIKLLLNISTTSILQNISIVAREPKSEVSTSITFASWRMTTKVFSVDVSWREQFVACNAVLDILHMKFLWTNINFNYFEAALMCLFHLNI